MNKLFQIDENSYIKLDCVEAIEKIDGKTIVYTKSGGKFQSNIPFESLRSIIELSILSEENKAHREEPQKEEAVNPQNKQFVSL